MQHTATDDLKSTNREKATNKFALKRKVAWLTIIVVNLVLYIGFYLAISRRGYFEADLFGTKGFYYFRPEDTALWRITNYGCAAVFFPINQIDQLIGTGMSPAQSAFVSTLPLDMNFARWASALTHTKG